MDHLPYPGDAGLPPIEIPYVCEEILPLFSGLDFSSMLATLPKCEIWYHGESSIAASKAQASIYFGLVREAAGPSFRIKDFVRKSDLSGQRVVTLKKLNDVWGWQSSRHRDEALKNLMDRLSPSLPRVFEHVAYIRGLDELGNLIGLSIKILIWSLAGTLPSGGWPRFGDDDILHQRMLDSGWCPYWTNIYGKRFSSPLIYCLTGLPRSRHGGHESCSQYESCKVYDVNPVTYVTEHTPRCEKQQCHFSGPDVRDLGLIVERGKIPLIRFSEKRRPLASHLLKRVRQGSATANDSDFKTAENNVIKIDLVEHTFGRPFIAISHVWAGGLGHFDKNTLPRCQLDLLYERARQCKQKLYGEGILASFLDFLDEADAKVSWEDKVIRAYHRFIIRATAEDTSTLYLWIDTLCIPADKEIPNLETRKKQAIDKMAHVYAMAMHVMVIDHTVQKLSFKDESEISLAGQLLTCPWMTRCWTFQEACLAREFSYLLQDGLINPRRWLSPAPEADTSSQPRTIFEETLMKECLNIFKEIPDVLNESVSDSGREDPAYPLFQVWDQLATRTTTVPEDSHGILAVMLGLSVEELFTENSAAPKEADSSPPVRSPSQRMLAILRAQTSLPLSMLYLPYPKGTRLCEDNEWVPKFASGSLDASFGRMDRVDDGLGWRFALSDTNSCAVILEADIKNLTDTAFYVHLGASLLGEGLRLESKVLQIRLKWTDAHNLEQKFGENSLFFILHGFNGNPSYRGACFSISKTTEMERVRLKFICPLEYRLELSKAANTKNGHDPAVLNYQVHWASNALVKATCILDCGKGLLDSRLSISLIEGPNFQQIRRFGRSWYTDAQKRRYCKRALSSQLELLFYCSGAYIPPSLWLIPGGDCIVLS